MTSHIDMDSLKHLGVNAACPVAGALVGLLIGWAVGYPLTGFIAGFAFGNGASIAASITREYDGKQFYGHWCWWDIFFDVIGLILADGLVILVAWLILR